MKIKIIDIIFRKDLYPRFEVDLKKIQEYAENDWCQESEYS